MDQKFQEVLDGVFTIEDDVDVPFMSDLERDAIPPKKLNVLILLAPIIVQNVLPEHPKARVEWSVSKTLNVVQVEA